jgi:hypothetical protein
VSANITVPLREITATTLELERGDAKVPDEVWDFSPTGGFRRF